ncbi:hypothetical protein CPB83DRAFT_906226 [Crepidotus variabilis]|uniref:Uncharacterized protein n=1 Tax=Crepidotus variabilis TaxID=179855 RepID=A0A9P6EGQ4_9AGAR|nr:hypothetical protein CPB83DRAFT_906226 [Crepidotus variabilis]
MSLKRKLESDYEDSFPAAKQLKLVPFPNMDIDTDVAMSEAEPLYPDLVHSRLHSTASSVTSSASESLYPTFELYPSAFDGSLNAHSPDSPSSRQSSPSSQIGLMQPASGFVHHGMCTQIPKLRVACASGVSGQRSMWTHCEECGAISIIESD